MLPITDPMQVFWCPFLSVVISCRLCLVGRSHWSSPAALLQPSFAIKSGAHLLHNYGENWGWMSRISRAS